MSQSPTVGRIVHYRLEGNTTVTRPAIVVQAWSANRANLQVFLDGANDSAEQYGRKVSPEEAERGMAWRGSVPYSEEPTPGTWCWPPRVG